MIIVFYLFIFPYFLFRNKQKEMAQCILDQRVYSCCRLPHLYCLSHEDEPDDPICVLNFPKFPLTITEEYKNQRRHLPTAIVKGIQRNGYIQPMPRGRGRRVYS